MARPALSADRTMEILDLFTAFPGRAFSMSEIIRATDINLASCFAVLNALSRHGYLSKRRKKYVLGSALIAIGQAAAATQTLITRAQAAAEKFNAELDVPVLLTTLVGNDILALTSLADSLGRRPSIRVGQRMPMVPPAGVHFVAWSSSEEVSAWIARAASDDEEDIGKWRHALSLAKARGFRVTLRSEQTPAFAELMQAMSAGTQPLEYRAKASTLMNEPGWALSEPEIIRPGETYLVSQIVAPIFDDTGNAVASLGFGSFAQPISGRQIKLYGDHLMEICLQIMLDDRTAGDLDAAPIHAQSRS